jgi:hypothetical protein
MNPSSSYIRGRGGGRTDGTAYTDQNGALSWTMLVILGSMLVFSGIVFVILWTQLSEANRDTQKFIDRRMLDRQELEDFLDAFPTECDCDGVNFTFSTTFPDDEFVVFHAGDPTEETLIVFDVTTFSTPGVFHTVSVRNESGFIAYLHDIPVYPTAFADDEFMLVHHLDNSKELVIDASDVLLASTVVLTFQDKSGEVAYLADIQPQHTVFKDDVFAVYNAADPTKEVQLYVGGLDPGMTVVMTVQNASGTIAYLANVTALQPDFDETEFMVVNTADPSKVVRLNVSALVSPGSTTTMTVQDKNGTIAYVDQVAVFTDYDITESRMFPDMANEEVETLAELGATRVEVWLCGGGGGGLSISLCPGDICAPVRNGGGSGAGFDRFVIEYASDRFTQFNCTIGEGGVPISGIEEPTAAQLAPGVGGTTVLEGIPNPSALVASGLLLEGFGGSNQELDTSLPGNMNPYGGVGGSNGGPSVEGSRPSGDLGGLPGAVGLTIGSGAIIATPGGVRYPWRAGSHGGSSATRFTTCFPGVVCPPSPFNGGGDGGLSSGTDVGGAGGMFGRGGSSSANPADNSCAGGWRGGPGGSGRIYLRVWTI